MCAELLPAPDGIALTYGSSMRQLNFSASVALRGFRLDCLRALSYWSAAGEPCRLS